MNGIQLISIKLILVLCLFTSSRSVSSQTSKIYIQNIGTCNFEPLCITSLFQNGKDSIASWDGHCKKNISSLIDVKVDDVQIKLLDSLIQKSNFIKSLITNVVGDTSYSQLENINLCMTSKYPSGSYIISAYDKKCQLKYQYLINDSNKSKSMFLFLKEVFLNAKNNTEIMKILDSNLEIIEACADQ